MARNHEFNGCESLGVIYCRQRENAEIKELSRQQQQRLLRRVRNYYPTHISQVITATRNHLKIVPFTLIHSTRLLTPMS